MSYISPTNFHKSLKAMKLSPQNAVKDGYWKVFVDNIRVLIDIANKHKYLNDNKTKTFMEDINKFISEDESKVNKKFEENSEKFNNEIKKHYEYLIHNILKEC